MLRPPIFRRMLPGSEPGRAQGLKKSRLATMGEDLGWEATFLTFCIDNRKVDGPKRVQIPKQIQTWGSETISMLDIVTLIP